ncbi:hypothetical protein DYZ85_00320 [Listeria monocytogenes]|nr:hypothetical protein DYZ85_00320 [Listeria monocytogenes]
MRGITEMREIKVNEATFQKTDDGATLVIIK